MIRSEYDGRTGKKWKSSMAAALSFCMLFSGTLIFPEGTVQAKEESRAAEESKVTWIMSQENNYWNKQELATTEWEEDNHAELYIDVDENITYQEMAEDVWGGCFSERGWHKLQMLSEEDRDRVLDLLFDPNEEDGLRLTMGRIPIGSNDYAMDLYSLDEEEDDYDLSEFSIDRDKEMLIPYIKEALERQPDLKLWASPWSPPWWMKEEETKAGGHIEYTEENMAAYAQYFKKFIEAYADEGIEITMVSPQNEPTMNTNYSSCLWTGDQLRDFIRDHLGPVMEEMGIQIYLGTFTDSQDSLMDPTLADPDARKYISGITFQWWSYNKARSLYKTGFDLGMMQSETMCGNGWNDWDYAENQFDVFWMYLENGISAYNLWNMVLDWDGVHAGGANTSGGWFQNAPITVNESTKEYCLNPQYYLVKHFSNFVKSGARRISSTGTYDAAFPLSDAQNDAAYNEELHEIAFRNVDGTNVLMVKNGSNEVKSVDINFNGRKVSVELPSNSLNTFTIQGTPLTGEETDMRQVVPENETVTIQNAASGLVLCIDGDKVSSGAKIIQWAYSDQGNQKWYLESSSVNGVDTVKLVNIKSGSIAAVNGASTAENATVILWPYEGGADQNWILEETEQEGYYKFKNANSGMYLTMNSTDRLTQATQMPESDAQGQLWKVSTVIEKPGTDMLKEFDQSIQASRELLEAYDPEAPVYTQESYEALVQALEAAEQVASNTNPNEGRNDKEAVERAFEELKAAIEGLVCLPSSQEKADLDEAIQRASGLDESKYTAESYTAVKVALEAAQRVDRENRDEVLAATEALSNALAALQEVSKPGDSTEKPGGSTEQPGGSTEQPDNGNQQKPSQTRELPKKNKVYRVGKLYYTVTKSSATAGTVSVKRPVKKNHTSIKIPKTVKINGYTFKVTSIGKKAFYNNRKLKRVTIGSNVTSIGKQAFATAKNLKTVVIKSTKMKSVKKNAFRGIAKKAVINVPNKKAVLRKYKRLLKKSNISSSIKVK